MTSGRIFALGRVIAAALVGLGAPRLAVRIFYDLSYQLQMSTPWAEAIGYVVYFAVQWAVVLSLMVLMGLSPTRILVGGRQWPEPSTLVKVFVLLVLTGLSLDYLWQLPWFALFPEKLSGLSEPNSANFFDEDVVAAGPAVLTTLLLLSAGPVIEEIFYRGMLLRLLAAAIPVPWAIAACSILFGINHSDPLAALFFSVVLCLIYLRTGSLYACIALHIAYNALQATLELLSVTFPDFYRSYDMFRPVSWWLHATILAASAALALDFARSLRRGPSIYTAATSLDTSPRPLSQRSSPE
jgi:membrane protease YdiL (CAAX protease family)